MPTYEYECRQCGHRFEERQSFSAEPVANCPSCNNGARRVIHSVPVVFKGSGFYVNDYGKGNGAARPSSQSSESKAEKDSKPDGKSKDGAVESGAAKKPEKGKEPVSAKEGG